jgi:hypothetical protein
MALFDERATTAAQGLRSTNDIAEWLGPSTARVDGRELALPLAIADCSIVANFFWVDVHAARRLVDDPRVVIPAPLPGKTLLTLLGVIYRDSPLGAYGEAAILFPARKDGPRSAFALPSLFGMLTGGTPQLVYRMAVDQEFTLHAGRFLWGYPKYLARIEVTTGAEKAEARLEHDGRLVFAMRAPAAESGHLPETGGRTLTVRDGAVRSIGARASGRGVAFRLGGTPPEIGTEDPLANELRSLGLPKTPLASASVQSARMQFDIARLLSDGP